MYSLVRYSIVLCCRFGELGIVSKGVQDSFQGIWDSYKAGLELLLLSIQGPVVGVLVIRALLFGVFVGAADFRNLPR